MPVTTDVLEIQRKRLKNCKRKVQEKKLLWLVATWAFAGSFRIHELLVTGTMEFMELS